MTTIDRITNSTFPNPTYTTCFPLEFIPYDYATHIYNLASVLLLIPRYYHSRSKKSGSKKLNSRYHQGTFGGGY